MPYSSPFSFSYAVGAALDGGGVAFRVWAGTHKRVSVRIENVNHELSAETNGYFHGHVPGAREGQTYQYFVDGKGPFPDPASRFQPQGPHGPSQIVNPAAFSWTDESWQGLHLAGQVIYEMHVGTFSAAGTWRSAIEQLPQLAELGVTALELMPVAEFEGSFGWGYDGVDLFAPTRNYGAPDDFRAFVDAAHAYGIGVILDVVYNHVGPDGNYLSRFSESYFTSKYKTDWGAAINFDGENSEPVREFYSANAAYWIKEFHLDGLRLDATQNIYDSSKDHILAEIVSRARKAAGSRSIIVVGENEPQNTKLIRPVAAGGYGMDALWNDDFHHSALVAATGSREAYYCDYLGSPQELLSVTKYGFLFQGQWYSWQKKRRGSSTLGLSSASMISFLQNHDQVANSARGLRLHRLTSPGRFRALTALCLLGPATPMLFQGQEFAASGPFLYFADHKPALADQVLAGRAEFLDQWRSLSLRELDYDDPRSRQTFDKCKLDFSEREKHRETYALHRDLLKLRKADRVFSRQDHHFDGEILGPEAFVVRFFSEGYQDDRLLVVNLGTELRLSPSPMPLLAPPGNCEWTVQWSSDDPKYGGNGTAPLDSDLNWIVPAQAAVVLKPRAKKSEGAKK